MGQDQSSVKDGQDGPTGAQGTSEAAAPVTAGSQGSTVATVPLAGIEGFQVVRLLPYSPAHKAGLVPYFDIITSLDHVLLESEGKPALQFFKSYVANHRDQPVCFTVFNLHVRAYRDVYCVPSDAWGGGGLLGCSIEWSHAEACPERCLHVVDVLEGSPAAHSGELKANRDYIIGMQTAQEPLVSLLKNGQDFYSRLEGWHEEQRWMLERKQRFPLEAVDVPHILLFLVYNNENNTVKEVAVDMGTNPESALGMSVATGLLHIIPSAATVGDAATASSLPVMNKFVQLEEDRAVISVVETPPPDQLFPSPPPPLCTQHVQPQQQDEVCPPSGNGYALPQDSNRPDERFVPAVPTALDVEPLSAPPPPPPDAASPAASAMGADAAAPPEYQPFYPSSQPQQHQEHEEQRLPYPMPPSFPDSFIPPPCDNVDGVGAGAVESPPQPPSSHDTQRPHSAKKSPFYRALASLDAYENPQRTASASTPAVLPPPVQQPPPAQQQHQHAVAEVAPPAVPPHTVPPVACPAPMVNAHDTRVSPPPPPPPPPPPQPAAPQRATFSMTHMPPPLQFPVFPGAAMKRLQK